MNGEISRASLGRIPAYTGYLRSLPEETATISAPAIARALGLGEVQVRKDLAAISGAGKPKVGYPARELLSELEKLLDASRGRTVIVGAGKLGRALLDYEGFELYGLSILAAFDTAVDKPTQTANGKPILPAGQLREFCREHEVTIGVIAVPASAAQEVCDELYSCGIRAMLCFAPYKLNTPATVQYENMALSLAHLKMQIR